MRNNPGGLLRAGLDVARLWLDGEAAVFNVQGRDEEGRTAVTQARPTAVSRAGCAQVRVSGHTSFPYTIDRLGAQRANGIFLFKQCLSISQGYGTPIAACLLRWAAHCSGRVTKHEAVATRRHFVCRECLMMCCQSSGNARCVSLFTVILLSAGGCEVPAHLQGSTENRRSSRQRRA